MSTENEPSVQADNNQDDLAKGDDINRKISIHMPTFERRKSEFSSVPRSKTFDTINSEASEEGNRRSKSPIKRTPIGQKILTLTDNEGQRSDTSSTPKGKTFNFINTNATEEGNRRKTITIRTAPTGEKILTLTDHKSNELPKDDTEKQSKGNIFSTPEGVTAREKKEASRVLKIDHLSKGVMKAGFDIGKVDLSQILHDDITDEYLQCLYIVATYTINNYFGIPGPKSDGYKKLSTFINQLIPLTSARRHENFEKSKTIPPPPFIITVHIIEAEDLMIKDADELSDPFCKVWLNGKKTQLKKTEVKSHTLNPTWNETFQFSLEDLRNDIIYIEVWDSDPTTFTQNLKQIKKIKGMRGCWYFCSDFMENLCCCGRDTVDDFLGKTEVEVGTLYAEGIDEWLSLKSLKGTPVQGQLHVAMKIEVTKPKNNIDALKRHLLLVRLCLERGLKENDSSDLSIFCWDQILNSSARTLLFQHSVQGNISVPEDMVCRFITIVHLAVQHFVFDFQFLSSVLKETKESVEQLQYINDPSLSSPLFDIYRQAVEKLLEICLKILGSLHSFDLAEDKAKRVEFESILKCVSLCQGVIGPTNLWTTLRSEAETWFLNKAQELKEVKEEGRNVIILNFLNFLKSYHKTMDQMIQTVFPQNSYTREVFEPLENNLCELLQFQVTQMAKESRGLTKVKDVKKKEEAIEVFGALKETTLYFSEIVQQPIHKLQLGQFHHWFGINTIYSWFAWRRDSVSARIEMIVNRDDLENKLIEFSGRCEKQTFSVKQSADLILKELYHLWKTVSLPNCRDTDDFFLGAVHSCCMKYLESLVEQIHTRKLMETFHNGGKKKLCAIPNNVWSLSCFVGNLIAESGIELLPESPDTKFSLRMACKILCADIYNETKFNVFNYVKKIFLAKTSQEQEQLIKEYAMFINKLIKREASADMSFEIYLLFINNIWNHVVKLILLLKGKKEMMTCANRLNKCLGKASNIYEGLLSILKETEEICYFDEEGKLKELMLNADYEFLKQELEQMKYNR
ncbi:protein unc-13 homolog D [Trichonephila clavata]|uniref:Protein unc-13 homolog D n=1 Tax=Trichonephila clavata TaxID=2740835 RepID=A0A8X6L180_TRICU|nr:protein unc-13 homolog D [Trichonephila clavata]